VQWDAGTPGESPRQIHSGEMAAAPPGVALPVGGIILELQPPCTRSLGENTVQLLDERRQRLWASSLETPFGDLAGLLLAIFFGRW
jgi:hypothetical protein